MKIIIPNNDDHGGNSFRELVRIWADKGLCEVVYKNVPHVWMNSFQDILLYDRPTLEWLKRYPVNYNFGLFGNTVPNIPNTSSWIFWGRRPSLMEDIKNNHISFEDRKIESIFLGKVENNVQNNKRTQHKWNKSIELFEMPIRKKYKYTQKEYLELLINSKYGLCLSGYGPKCNREIELLGMGVVPIITPLVDLTYYNPLIEDVHYIKVNNPSEIKDKIKNIGKHKWEEMSNNGIKWYEKNCSPNGSFVTTCEILEKNNIKI